MRRKKTLAHKSHIWVKASYWLVIMVLASGLLAACGNDAPTATPVPKPSPTATPPPPPAYLAQVDFDFSDQAEQAERTLVNGQPGFPAYATWTQSSHWFILARDSDDKRLRAQAGPNARISPVGYVAESLNQNVKSYPVYMIVLNRSSLDVKAGGTQDTAKLLFNRAVSSQMKGGLLTFTIGDDQIYELVSTAYTAEQVMSLASFGKVELVSAGAKALADSSIVNTSASPSMGGPALKNSTVYQTIAQNSDFASFKANSTTNSATGILGFQLQPASKVFDYSRSNIGQFAALIFDRQVIASAQIAQPIKDSGQIQVARWGGSNGYADMQRFISVVTANPAQLFEAKEILSSNDFVVSGSFTR